MMKYRREICIMILITAFAVVVNSCNKDNNDPDNPTNGRTEAIFNQNVNYGTMTDQDGNTYKTITIGTQTWMAENLRTTKYRNGEPIPEVTPNTNWAYMASGAYCNYNNTTDIEDIATYGRLYNWYTVSDSRNIAPAGWRVPTNTDWNTLVAYLGAAQAGGKLKETGTTHWTSPNTGATNESGFTALPGGCRWYPDGAFYEIGIGGLWWTSTPYSQLEGTYLGISNDFSSTGLQNRAKQLGLSVRCVKE